MPIKLDNASKRIRNQWVFRDVSFEISDGEVFGIFGPNGAGKSELLASLPGGISEPGGFLQKLFGSGKEPLSDRLKKVNDTIASASQSLVLPDPFSGLDAFNRVEVADAIRKTAVDKRLPVLISTADFADVLAICDRAAILAGGYIQQIGTPQELYDEPSNRLVAELTGRCNLIEARRLTSSKSEMPEFQTIDGEHRLFTQKMELRTLGAINKNAVLAIRPEQIVLSFGASFPEDNLLKAVISNVQFYGPSTYVELDCEGLRLEAMVTKLVGIGIGGECMVGLPPDRIRVLAE